MLFVGDGNLSRQYRTKMLSGKFTQTGITHCEMINGLIIVMATDFKLNEKGEKEIIHRNKMKAKLKPGFVVKSRVDPP